MTTTRTPLKDHPQGRKLLGAVARAERMREHIDGLLQAVDRGIANPTELARLRSLARDTEAMWLALVQKRSIEHEAPMRFLDAVAYVSKLNVTDLERATIAADTFAARLPDIEVKPGAFVEAIGVWKSKRRSWNRLRQIIRYGIPSAVLPPVQNDRADSLRVMHTKWRQGLRSTSASAKPPA